MLLLPIAIPSASTPLEYLNEWIEMSCVEAINRSVSPNIGRSSMICMVLPLVMNPPWSPFVCFGSSSIQRDNRMFVNVIKWIDMIYRPDGDSRGC